MIRLPTEFREFLSSLNDNQVIYLLIGGYAVGYHGYPRATADIDIWIKQSEENADRVVRALNTFGFAVPELDRELFLKKNSLVRMGYPPLRIEIQTSISGVSFGTCYNNRIEDALDGIPVSIIGLDCLIRNKKSAGRPRDVDDIQQLLR